MTLKIESSHTSISNCTSVFLPKGRERDIPRPFGVSAPANRLNTIFFMDIRPRRPYASSSKKQARIIDE